MMADHIGYDKHDPVGRNGQNSGNGTRTKTVLTDIGPVEFDVPVTARASSSRGSCRSGSGVWMKWTRSCCR
jgi:transposase-like protein